MADIEITSHVDEVMNLINIAAQRGLIACGMEAESNAKISITEADAVVTGRLRNSITYATKTYSGKGSYADDQGHSYSDATARTDIEEKTVIIGTNVEYARFIEEGARSYQGIHFMKRAWADHIPKYKALLEESLRNI